MTDTTHASEPSGAQKMSGDFAPGLAHVTDDVLFGEVWKRRSCRRRNAAWLPWRR